VVERLVRSGGGIVLRSAVEYSEMAFGSVTKLSGVESTITKTQGPCSGCSIMYHYKTQMGEEHDRGTSCSGNLGNDLVREGSQTIGEWIICMATTYETSEDKLHGAKVGRDT
jgi:hypothetical protein